MTIFLSVYLIIGVIITSVLFHVATIGISSEKFNFNKCDILAIKILMGVGMTVAYPIVMLLVILGRNDE